MFRHLDFTSTVRKLSTFQDLMDYHRHTPDGCPKYAELELEAFKHAQMAFLKTYEACVLSRIKTNYPQKPCEETVDENKKIIKGLYSEIKDVHHDDEGYPFVKTGDPDSDSGLSSDSDSDSDGVVEEIPMPTKTRIIRRKPKN